MEAVEVEAEVAKLALAERCLAQLRTDAGTDGTTASALHTLAVPTAKARPKRTKKESNRKNLTKLCWKPMFGKHQPP
jgi:hypothetical protein